jgi:hypothetical protein
MWLCARVFACARPMRTTMSKTLTIQQEANMTPQTKGMHITMRKQDVTVAWLHHVLLTGFAVIDHDKKGETKESKKVKMSASTEKTMTNPQQATAPQRLARIMPEQSYVSAGQESGPAAKRKAPSFGVVKSCCSVFQLRSDHQHKAPAQLLNSETEISTVWLC